LKKENEDYDGKSRKQISRLEDERDAANLKIEELEENIK